MMRGMSEKKHHPVIDGLGGTTAVAKMIGAPVTTVHAWRKNGIPPWRLEQLKVRAAALGKSVPEAVA